MAFCLLSLASACCQPLSLFGRLDDPRKGSDPGSPFAKPSVSSLLVGQRIWPLVAKLFSKLFPLAHLPKPSSLFSLLRVHMCRCQPLLMAGSSEDTHPILFASVSPPHSTVPGSELLLFRKHLLNGSPGGLTSP